MKCWHGIYGGIGCDYCEGHLKDERSEYESDLRAKLTAAESAFDEARAEVAAMRKAGVALLESLGEYVRQSMYHNPEWRSGIRAMETALSSSSAGTTLLDRMRQLEEIVKAARDLLSCHHDIEDAASYSPIGMLRDGLRALDAASAGKAGG